MISKARRIIYLARVLFGSGVIAAASAPTALDAANRACKVFCSGPLLDAVQRAGLFEDQKTFVDLPLKQDPEVVLEAFYKLEKSQDPDVLRAFLAKFFDKTAGEELLPWTPPDFVERPQRLGAIVNSEHRAWALELNKLWKTLGRIQDEKVAAAPQRHSALKRRFGMVVPGGRFRETYYWDTYWIVRGLLLSDLVETARGVVENLLDDVRVFGFVPNGGRVYYLDRSQPPFLTEMVRAVHEAAPNATWLASVLPVLEQEHRFWMDPTTGHSVPVPAAGSAGEEPLRLNIYFSKESSPRPESYAQDLNTSLQAEHDLGRSKEEVWHALRSGAESGWDFSSRWLAAAKGGPANLTTVNASAVVPVDLNSVLYRVERSLAHLHRELAAASASTAAESTAHSMAAASHSTFAAQRALAMNSLLWDKQTNTYHDYRLDAGAPSKVVALSDYSAPLWAGLTGPGEPTAGAANMVASLMGSGLMQAGGGSTTTLFTGQQWDAPNAWAPVQHMLVEGLDLLQGNAEASQLADRLVAEWLESGFTAWNKTHVMYEKYNAYKPGSTGGGGEYHPQIGFGWTNGVALVFMVRENRSQTSIVPVRKLMDHKPAQDKADQTLV